MSARYAKQQPSGFKNRVEKIAIVGAAGYQGKHIVEQLLKTGKHSLTAITRENSSNSMPSGVAGAKVNYDDHESLVKAMRGHDAVIITMWSRAPPETQDILAKAAIEAGVRWILPNEWGTNTDSKDSHDTFLGAPRVKTRKAIVDQGGQWIGVANGFWYEYSLPQGPDTFGFDLDKRTVRLYEDGHRKLDLSPWPHVGRAVAAVLSLPELPKDENDKTLTVSHWRNDFVYVNSFSIDQRDMLASLNRVLGLKDSDWTLEHGDAEKVHEQGKEKMFKGDMRGFMEQLYARKFFPDGCGQHTVVYRSDNEKLGLPKEDLDEYTKLALKLRDDGLFAEYHGRS